MNSNSFYDRLKCSIESMKEKSLLPLLENDYDYQQFSTAGGIAEERYMQLNLSDEQQKVIGDLLDARDNENSEYSNLSYLAGIIDCIKFLGYLNVPVDETMNK